MLSRALAMALSKESQAPTKPKTQPPQSHPSKETRSSAHWSRVQSTGRRAKTTPAPTETPSQQRLSSAVHTQSSSLLRASRSQQKLVAASETRNKLSDENQRKMEALVRALDAALQKDAPKPQQPSSPSSSSQEAEFEAEALTGQFPILAIAPPDQKTTTGELPPPPMPTRSETKTADPSSKEHRFFQEDNNPNNLSDQAINQAAERLTAELRASLAFFSSDELQKGQEDPESMLNDILDIIAGQEQKNFSQETLTAILDQTLQNLQGPQYDYSSISDNFTPAGLEAMSSSQVQINPVIEASSFPPLSPDEAPSSSKDNATASSQQKTSPATSQNEEDQAFEELFGQAMTIYLRRQYKQALALFEECLQLRPDDPRTLYNIERLRKRIN